MKPTVINNSNSENTNPNHAQSPSDSNNNTNTANNTNGTNARRFTQFPQGFGFEDPDDDVFSNMGLRSRLNRMGHPFDWPARKRRGSGQASGTSNPDLYDQYFRDDVDFPHFGSTWDAFNRAGNKRDSGDRSGFFDYLPSEFRQYIPDNFGFGMRHQVPSRSASHPSQQFDNQQPQYSSSPSQQQSQQHYPSPSQQQQPQSPPQQPYYVQQTNPPRNLCDAAIQTDEPGLEQQPFRLHHPQQFQHPQQPHQPLHHQQPHPEQHRIAKEDVQKEPKPQQSSIGTPSYTESDGPGSFAHAGTAMTPQVQFYPQNEFNYPQSQQPLGQPPNKQHHAQQQQYYQNPQTPPQASAYPPQYYQQSPPTSAPIPHPQQFQSNKKQGLDSVRTVPIYIEGRDAHDGPAASKNVHQQQQQQQQQYHQAGSPGAASGPSVQRQYAQPRPEPFTNKEAFHHRQASPQPNDHQQAHEQPLHEPNRGPQQPVPQEQQDRTEESQTGEDVVPQTPHTVDCITKIQAIQRDVLDLMCAVEQFGGSRGDKEYMYLDEMLTRNLLKLDTIDTNGKDSIRLARKEAIKCIQASIAVLEAKAALNLNGKQEAEAANPNVPVPVQASSGQNEDSIASDVIPKIQENVENITLSDSRSNVPASASGGVETTKSDSKIAANTEPATAADPKA